MRILAAGLLLTLALRSAPAQSRSKAPARDANAALPDLSEVVSVHARTFAPPHPQKTAEVVVDDIVDWTIKGFGRQADPWRPAIVKNYIPLCSFFKLMFFNGSSAQQFCYRPGSIPVIAFRHNGKVGVMILGLLSPHTYNTNRVKPLERAGTVAKELVLGPLRNVDALDGTGFDELGIHAVLTSRNFTDSTALTDVEHIIVVAPIALCKQLRKLEITDTDLLRQSDVFALNSETGRSFVKTALTLQ